MNLRLGLLQLLLLYNNASITTHKDLLVFLLGDSLVFEFLLCLVLMQQLYDRLLDYMRPYPMFRSTSSVSVSVLYNYTLFVLLLSRRCVYSMLPSSQICKCSRLSHRHSITIQMTYLTQLVPY